MITLLIFIGFLAAVCIFAVLAHREKYYKEVKANHRHN